MLRSLIALALAYETGRSAGVEGWRHPARRTPENPYNPMMEADLRLEWYYGYMDLFADLQAPCYPFSGTTDWP